MHEFKIRTEDFLSPLSKKTLFFVVGLVLLSTFWLMANL